MMRSAIAEIRNIHRGETVVVCGCGSSLTALKHPERFLTIGVNDVGRLFTPDYLVVLNPKRQFASGRFHYVENSKARAIFTQLDLGISHPRIVRFELGRRGGADWRVADRLHYTRNSPYLALQLALYMGATRVGLIGVDFTGHHFFANTGRHPLTARLDEINREYAAVQRLCEARGIEVFNLSAHSRLAAFPKMPVETFSNLPKTPLRPSESEKPKPFKASGRESTTQPMRIAIEKHSPGIVGDFLQALAATASSLGHTVTRDVAALRRSAGVLSIVWNGRRHRSAGPTLYGEHAWLPRWEYQISPRGINADSHLAPFIWDGKPLSDRERQELERHLDAIRESGPPQYRYMQTAEPPVAGLPDEFLLVPLQMEWDTNIQRHVPPRFRRMQALIDHISAANPPFPVLYKQHPADVRRGGRQLRLRLRRRQDCFWEQQRGNIHQVLKSGRCRGIIALNSNVVHDGLVWNVPAVVLGNNVWPRSGKTPFLTSLPAHWAALDRQHSDPETVECRRAYAWYLIQNQWDLSDARNEGKVAALLRSAAPARSRAAVITPPVVGAPHGPVVNVVARNRGWFFEDLKHHFQNRSSNMRVLVSERPERTADSWIFIRTREAAASPDPRRTVVQIHDMFDHGFYGPRGERVCVRRCAALMLTHPEQENILVRNGIQLANKSVVTQPLGALEAFQVRETLPAKFTLAWVGRPVTHFGREWKRIEWFVEAVQRLGDVRVVLLGENLEAPYDQLRRAGVDCEYLERAAHPISTYPAHYRRFDCVAVTSISEAGPLCLFEALASGVPVVSTRVGWAPQMIRPGENGYLADSPAAIAEAVASIQNQHEAWFARRHEIRQSLGGYTIESWVDACLDLAGKLARRRAA